MGKGTAARSLGLVQATRNPERPGQIELGRGIRGRQCRGTPVSRERFLGTAQCVKHGAEVVFRFGVRRLEVQGAAITLLSLGKLAAQVLRACEPEMSLRIFGNVAQRLFIAGKRSVEVALLLAFPGPMVEDNAEIFMRHRMLGRPAQRFSKTRRRFGPLALLP